MAVRPLRAAGTRRRPPTVHDNARQAIDDLRARLADMVLPAEVFVPGPWPAPPRRTLDELMSGHLAALERAVDVHEAL